MAESLAVGKLLGIAGKVLSKFSPDISIPEVTTPEISQASNSSSLTEAQKKLYGRVTRPKDFRDQVWENSKDINGDVYNPDGQILKKDEPWDAGHLPSNKFSADQVKATQEGWTRQQWNRYQNDSAIYRAELPSTNQGHQFETQ